MLEFGLSNNDDNNPPPPEKEIEPQSSHEPRDLPQSSPFNVSPSVVNHDIPHVPQHSFAIIGSSRHGSFGSVDVEPFDDGSDLGNLIISPDSATTNFLPAITLPISSSTIQTTAVDVSAALSVSPRGDVVSPAERSRSESHLKLYGKRMQLPFANHQEALLFQHYTEKLAQMVRPYPNISNL
jgi:hypothetical protein